MLVAVELFDIRLAEKIAQPGGGEFAQLDKGAFPGGFVVDMHDLPGVVGMVADVTQKGINIHRENAS